MHTTLDEAIETAGQAMWLDRQVVRPEFWCGYTVLKRSGKYHVYSDNSFAPPGSPGLLPWYSPLQPGDVVVGRIRHTN
ncbi:Uncharacterised protein [Mycobacteroides abscessus subsp. abscessus]|nr:Uncharacterised protein [Mycobacteroides abscessus subsp. abscessus]SHZ93307.1 Uncharacterised protein [Mycobacteroides abscessus subsp. abscessus]SIE08087.1 Uncharacterised protein [Mycobacteroides abscessus subsp. abscessus]SIE64613.1 Uncharacterised protein [Mycobacteroides abscessus subsp. abscessus]SIF74235.1 Uncharacterised protein [Mycobacteroides abscessus subsp. abscessus]